MAQQSRLSEIKRAQKAAHLYKIFSQLFWQITLDDPSLQGLTLVRVDLSADKGVCYLFFHTPEGEQMYEKLLPRLLLYRPSLRKAVSQLVPGRYTPELEFRFDIKFEKQQRLEKLFAHVLEPEKETEPSHAEE